MQFISKKINTCICLHVLEVQLNRGCSAYYLKSRGDASFHFFFFFPCNVFTGNNSDFLPDFFFYLFSFFGFCIEPAELLGGNRRTTVPSASSSARTSDVWLKSGTAFI